MPVLRGLMDRFNRQRVASLAWLVAFCLFTGSVLGAEDEAFTESVVIFNTICAKCHEAECSGRLSFDEAFEKSTGHILRHYVQASGKQWLQKELFFMVKQQILNKKLPQQNLWVIGGVGSFPSA